MRAAEQSVDVGAVIDSQGIGGAQWILIILCGSVALLDGLDLQAIGLAAPAIAQQLHIPPQSLGAVFSAALAGLMLGAFALGPTADRVGRKGVLVSATFLFGVFTLATAHAETFKTLLAYRFLAGVGLGGAMPSFISLASEYVPAKHRAAIVSLLWAAFPLGGTAGGLIASRLIPAYGWQSIFLVGGTLPLVIAAILLIALPESLAFLINSGKPVERIARTFRRVFPRADAPPNANFVFAREAKTKADVRELFSGGRAAGTLLLWVAYFFAFMILVTNSSWVPSLLRPLGVPVESSAVALAMFNFGSLFGSGAAGLLIETFGPVLILSATMLGGAAAFASIGWAAPSVTFIMIAETAFGFLVGCASSGLIALAAIYYPSAIRSTGVGWATAMGRFGSFVGPLVVGSLLAAHWSVHTIFTAVGASIVIGAIACMLMPSSRAKS